MLGYPFLKKFKKSKIKRRKEIEPQEVFLDNLAKKKEREVGISEKKIEVPLSKKIIFGVFSLFVFFALIGMGQAFYLQVLKNKDFIAKAEENKFITQFISSSRGVIYDINGKQLTYNNPSFDLIYNQNSEPLKSTLQELSKILGLDLSEIKKRIEQKREIAENLNHQTLIILQTKNFPGFEIKKNSIRYYEDGTTLSHIIGYMGRINSEKLKNNADIYTSTDNVGKDGLEKYYENYLRKNPGEMQIERDVYGNILFKKLISMPESGNNLVLWIDFDLQKKAKESLEAIIENAGAEKAAAVIQNPQTGAIMAIISIPGYDNNLFNREADQEELTKILTSKDQPLFNRATTGLYVTGSTIKPLIAATALKEKIISPNKNIHCVGSITIPNKYDPEKETIKKDWSVHGSTDMRKAIAESCNVYFYTIGGGYEDQKGLGPTKIKEGLELFGWSSKTGVDLPSEAEGFIPSPEWKEEVKKETWWDGDTYNLSIGQGDILITPIQVVNAFSVIANGGTLFKPQIVKEIIDSEKNTVKEFTPEKIKEGFINPDYLQIVREGMRKAVTGQGAPQASSIILNSLPVSAAAKTGTAETPKKDIYHNWVTVFAPYENPEIVLTIVLENVPGIQSAALPAAKEILQWYFNQ